GLSTGMCTLFIRHTSASLIIQENYDPSARADLETFMDRLVPENAPWITHTLEGQDDMPSHIKSVLTQVSLSIPILDGRLALGTWQGIYLWEHRDSPSPREILVSVY
ncbi:MAG TPA: secondary thiamine-phosphate synthase enzyme YjbQ, partial [Planctomycetota bacterium]|nr:secondary thiamine-phosphate synthase enzyme YjbQ [Planctomycetota bacterium]